MFNVVTTTLFNAFTTTLFNAVDSQNQVGVSKGMFNAKNEVVTYIFEKNMPLISIQIVMFLINVLHLQTVINIASSDSCLVYFDVRKGQLTSFNKVSFQNF